MNKIEAAIQCAQDQYCAPSDNDIELDDNPEVTPAADNSGIWVQAWVFVRMEDIDEEIKAAA